MDLTFFLIDQTDTKIAINGVKIIQNVLMFASNKTEISQENH